MAGGGSAGATADPSEYLVSLHPPREDVADVQETLDALMKLEDAKRLSAEEEFAAAKQKLLIKEKAHLRNMAFGSLAQHMALRTPAI